MQLPGTPSLLLLFFVLIFVPWLAYRGARRTNSNTVLPSRASMWSSTIILQILLLALAWIVGNTFGYDPFAGPSTIRMRDIGIAIVALASFFLMRLIIRAFRDDEERRKMLVYRIAPRNGSEWALWIVVVLAASISEEVVYRGVTMQILWYSLGNPWLAAVLGALAFAAAHWAQGLKSGVMIFAIAIVMHALVALTRTLILAMTIHAIYDFIAGCLISREATRLGLVRDDTSLNQSA
jgi:membrane protease YdiL (CAAX protease family)